ncbi:Hsp27-ERE-TATA-binding protein/Scaffold attachment factor (SAF-B) [Trichoderma guizhouense]|uniref:Hsp27-ERE-TATA-binding protein/Scaffold attachment factor (SAF-B) n=1 Tax=Trichoderma guizhouense TaxID=1491466 RepID=A0A1T3CB11_9HYPO|nr:Hsp27-ERE-TATA-binding protein/Scaffold attachment factor (SAF-B) [Trichoderma guizhouense]
MASVLKDKDEMESAISKLAIDSAKAAPKGKAKAKKPVADSWEDEDVSDEEDKDDQTTDKDDADVEAGTSTPSSLATPAVPPPTPASPLGYDSPHEWASLGSQSQSQSQSQSPMATSASGSGAGTPAKRPEKTDAVARRMIAAGLGLKAPRQTEEQRAYQRSVREQEKKRRDAERAEEERQKELAEKAKAAVWDD